MLPVGKKSYRGSASLMSLGSGSAQLGAAASGGKQQRKATLTSLASSVPTVQTAHDLDLLYRTLFRAEMRTEAAVAIQAAWRGHALRTFILPFEAVALRLQAGLRARLEARRRRQNRAATRIQAVARGRRGRRIAAEVRRAQVLTELSAGLDASQTRVRRSARRQANRHRRERQAAATARIHAGKLPRPRPGSRGAARARPKLLAEIAAAGPQMAGRNAHKAAQSH